MKELSVEEKTKRYDEILARATGAHLPYYTEDIMTKVREFVEYLLPELKESEDEKIRKEIISAVNIYCSEYSRGTKVREDMLAWLEEQREQKLTPIFRIGDTIIAKDGTYIEKEPFHIDMIEDDCYWDGENTILVCNQDKFEIFKQKPAEWSDDDKKLIDDTCRLINMLASGYGEKVTEPITLSGTQMIASIKDRLRVLVDNRPKSTWRPSGEQMEVI